MAKSLRSKIQMRWRKLKRDHVVNTVVKQKHVKVLQTLSAAALGIEYREKQLKNGYLHPNDPESQFPQVKPAPIIDLRSSSIPGSGRQWSGANRKCKTITEQYKKMDQIEAEDVESEPKETLRQQKGAQRMIEQASKSKNGTSYKVKKAKKSKLRKTIVF